MVPHALANGHGRRFVPGLPKEDAAKAERRVKIAKQKKPLPPNPPQKTSPPTLQPKVAPQPELPTTTITKVSLPNPLPPARSLAKCTRKKCASKKQSRVNPKAALPKKRSLTKPPPSQKEPKTVKNLQPSQQVEFTQPPDIAHSISCLPLASNALPATLHYKPVDQVCHCLQCHFRLRRGILGNLLCRSTRSGNSNSASGRGQSGKGFKNSAPPSAVLSFAMYSSFQSCKT